MVNKNSDQLYTMNEVELIVLLSKIMERTEEICSRKDKVWEFLKTKILSENADVDANLLDELKVIHMRDYDFYDIEKILNSFYDFIFNQDGDTSVIEDFYATIFQIPDQIKAFWILIGKRDIKLIHNSREESIRTNAGVVVRAIKHFLAPSEYKEELMENNIYESEFVTESEIRKVEHLFNKVAEDAVEASKNS